MREMVPRRRPLEAELKAGCPTQVPVPTWSASAPPLPPPLLGAIPGTRLRRPPAPGPPQDGALPGASVACFTPEMRPSDPSWRPTISQPGEASKLKHSPDSASSSPDRLAAPPRTASCPSDVTMRRLPARDEDAPCSPEMAAMYSPRRSENTPSSSPSWGPDAPKGQVRPFKRLVKATHGTPPPLAAGSPQLTVATVPRIGAAACAFPAGAHGAANSLPARGVMRGCMGVVERRGVLSICVGCCGNNWCCWNC
mmetsp:Transcript_31426/g.80111  ORF Transcript_31426/g.80111 Transcript_31426/m.80111 type:complete len:253 (+) Transcript_31426:183-941(+)